MFLRRWGSQPFQWETPCDNTSLLSFASCVEQTIYQSWFPQLPCSSHHLFCHQISILKRGSLDSESWKIPISHREGDKAAFSNLNLLRGRTQWPCFFPPFPCTPQKRTNAHRRKEQHLLTLDTAYWAGSSTCQPRVRIFRRPIVFRFHHRRTPYLHKRTRCWSVGQ